jgi:ATP-dependent Clp protease ATP-binding subunit ClpC
MLGLHDFGRYADPHQSSVPARSALDTVSTLETMFERFTDRARRSVVLAQEEARSFNHNYIGTEHLLLGLFREGEGLAAKVLHDVGLDIEVVRSELDTRVGRGASQPKGHIPFTPRAKKVLEISLREALKLGHNYIGTEHILLGLLREGEGVAAQIIMTRVDGGLERVVLAARYAIGGGAAGVGKASLAHIRETVAATMSSDDVIKRLEAIEARLSTIERLLRDQRGETEAS